MNWYLSALKKYAVFSGRARRKEYWFFQLFNTIIMTVLIVIDNVTGIVGPGPSPGMPGAGFPRLGLLSGLFCLGGVSPVSGRVGPQAPRHQPQRLVDLDWPGAIHWRYRPPDFCFTRQRSATKPIWPQSEGSLPWLNAG